MPIGAPSYSVPKSALQRLVQADAREDLLRVRIDRALRDVLVPRAVVRQQAQAVEAGIGAELDLAGLGPRRHRSGKRRRECHGQNGALHENSRCHSPTRIIGHARPAVNGVMSTRGLAVGEGQEGFARLQRLGPKQLHRLARSDVLEERLADAQDDGMHNEPKLIEQAGIDEAADQRGAADRMDVLARLTLEVADDFDLLDDPGRLPADLVQRPGEHEMGRLVGEVGVGDLTLRGELAGEGQGRFGIVQDGKLVLLIARVHPAAEDARVDLVQKAEVIRPGLDPVEFTIGPFDEAVERYLHRRDDLAHVSSIN